ncbi:uncharacterized protein LOC110065267 isoform X2 [Orbicella faveolata]|uniref:uncharacterized protein LOC110065267 isoform X1 n=1 Tax=Orbicella faveolata TaxID=48498 RepID=UPI0009E3E5D6|nr:uncharacterized protein LOC110065267 isoform X1 [Orbicella faveolata]XP_020628036.1 uncharacterized protein LOC110065267 isoform X2 [Orbicella faveolata]
MIRTILWFGGAGLFASCYSNLVRGYPAFRKPLMHVFYTSAFLWLGYKAHQYEERAEENYEEMVKKHKNVPWWPRAQLLAERAERLKTEKEAALAEMEEATA